MLLAVDRMGIVSRTVGVAILVATFAMAVACADAEVGAGNRGAVALKARPFALKDVELLDGPFRDARERTRAYLHDLESDRLLHFFRETAGLPASGKPMGGWESRDLRGHTMGHYLSACAIMYASTGDDKLKDKADAIVAELAKCQQAHGNGYLSAFPESFIDRAIARRPVWAPWYTLHKILAGLMDMYVHCDNAQALEIAEGMAGWAGSRLEPLDTAAMQAMLDSTEQGGMNEALANLYGLTGKRPWLELSRRFNQRRYREPLARREDRLQGEHANSFIPNIVGTARQYELIGCEEDRRIATFFWEQVVRHRTYCTGGTSEGEHWHSPPDVMAEHITGNLTRGKNVLANLTQETCCTYNLLKLTRHLFSWEPRNEYAEFYERALINSILASQDPHTGMMMYFLPLGSGRWKYFNTPRDSFWCCTGTGMENHAGYGAGVYFHDDHGVWVNLYIPSQLAWDAKGVRIRQETAFPEVSRTKLVIEADRPTEFILRLRVPAWTRRPVVTLNAQPTESDAVPGRFLEIRRTWKTGDFVELSMPMHLWTQPMPDDPTLVAVMYGPMVLAGELSSEQLPDGLVYRSETYYKRARMPEQWFAEAPHMVTDQLDPAAWVKAVPGKTLTFRTDGVGRPRDVSLVPYHRLWGRRYAVYWRVSASERE